MDGQQDALGRSPELFPYSLDARDDTVSFIRLRQDEYAQASFLDARILAGRNPPNPLPWPRVTALIETAELTECCHYLFHIGHVGSTLLSRLIGAHRGAFALREPVILRQLAQVQSMAAGEPRPWDDVGFAARLSGAVKLLSRTFDTRQRAVVKATSFVSELASQLLSRPAAAAPAAPAAVMIFVSVESYLATILGGPNSRQEARLLTATRLRRLHRRIGQNTWRLESMSEGEAVALGWACEMAALADAAHRAGQRVLRLDFDAFLADPQRRLLAAFRHLKIDASASEADDIIRGPHMRRYSKAPEYAYDALLRREVLEQARALQGPEIRRGLGWLEQAAADHAPIREAVRFSRMVE
jgi:hypothetical protein